MPTPTTATPLDKQESVSDEIHSLGALFEDAPLGICLVGLDERFLKVNDTLCQILGYASEELLAITWTRLVFPGDLDILRNRIEQLTPGSGEHQSAEIRIIHRSGAPIWVVMRTWMVRDRIGMPFNVAVQMEDVTERKQKERTLRESEDRFRVMADNSPAMMWATDAKGTVQFMNIASRKFCGLDSGELDPRKWRLLTHPSNVPEYAAEFERAIRERSDFSQEARVQRADGEWRLVGSKAKPSLSPTGDYLGHIGLSADISDRRQAELARQFELSMIQSIHAETLEGILVVNEKGLIVSLNKRFLEIWRISSPSASGQLLDTITGTLDLLVLSHIAGLMEAPEVFIKRIQELYEHPDEVDHCEIELRDGRTVERHSTGLRNPVGAYLGRVWFFRDITTHKRAEVSLQNAKDDADEANRQLLAERTILESERKILRVLIDNIPEFMYVKDKLSRFVLANCHLASMVGVNTPEELLGKTDFDFYPPELANAFYQDEQDLMRSGQPLYNHEEKGLDEAGNETRILTTKVPIRDNNGQIVGIAGVGRDITARTRMENALKEAEQKYRGIFNNSIVGIFQSTPDGVFLNVNPAMASIFGYDSQTEMIASVTNIACDIYVDPKRREELKESIDRLGGLQSVEGQAFRKDGAKIWVSMSIRATFQDGVAVRYDGMCEDITERIALREQLLQAQKLESVGQLAAGIAHEINTPTQYIGDNVQFLKDSFNDLKNLIVQYERLLSFDQRSATSCEAASEVAAFAKRVDAAFLLEEIPKAIEQTLEGVIRVSTIVAAMKEFSHPGTKEKIPLDLNHAIESTITVARNEWRYVADVETDLDPSLPQILCQPGEFNQVILNLIVNAAHAITDVVQSGRAAKGKITVQTLNSVDWAEVRIQDTGGGIPEEIRARVFDPFFTTKEIGKGTGQGLAIARSVVVDKHGGTIHFETQEGVGTAFIVRLPHNEKSLAHRRGVS